MEDFGVYLRKLRGERSLREMERITGVSHTYLRTIEKGVDPRNSNGITQKQLAEKIGKSESAVRMIELGKNKPTPDVLKRISETLNVSYIELMEKAGYIAGITDLENENGKLKEALQRACNSLGADIEDYL
ncbi:helix-turn-helix transcriptional regulator [Viridibacillus arvi]|uniref:helix-turn-helix transcriptional regulator n=1 Tax=Viridibacillus arvi TaxID=263475 RepID=UPI003D2B8E9D